MSDFSIFGKNGTLIERDTDCRIDGRGIQFNPGIRRKNTPYGGNERVKRSCQQQNPENKKKP
jgi:hypothetical protein